MSRFEENRAADRYAAQEVAAVAAWKKWISAKHPELYDGEAYLLAFREEMGGAFLTADDDDFEYALKTMITTLSKRHVPTEKEIKAELTEKILDLLQKGGTGYDQFNLNTARKKMEHWNVQQLTARLDEITRAQQMSKQPIAEVQKILKDARQYTGYPQLGKTVVRPGTVYAAPLDAAYLRGLDVWELKKYTRLYGVEQVNNRLAGKD